MLNRTLTRSFDILNYISNQGEKGVSLSEIISYFDMPKSSAFDIVQTLLSLRLLEPIPYNDKRYVLGLAAFELGLKYSGNKDLITLCTSYLAPLADELNRTAFAGVLDGQSIVYIYKHVGENAKLATCKVGTRHDAYTTSLGKALLAYIDDEQRDKILDEIVFVDKTGRTVKNKEELLEQLTLFKHQGYSIDNKENESLMVCYGAPIFDFTGKPIAAISVSDVKLPNVTDREIGEKIRDVALQISRTLGYRGVFYNN